MKTTQESSLLHGEHLPKAQYVKSEDSGHRSSFSRIGPQCQSLSFFFLCQSLYKRELQPLVAHMRIRKSRQQKHDLKLPERPTPINSLT